MLKFIVKSHIKDYNIWWAIKKSLTQSALLVQWKAVKNAPYETWTLRRSITNEIKKDTAIIWTNVRYAKVREYVNKKNPWRKFYMKRALESSYWKIKQIFTKNIKNVLND